MPSVQADTPEFAFAGPLGFSGSADTFLQSLLRLGRSGPVTQGLTQGQACIIACLCLIIASSNRLDCLIFVAIADSDDLAS